MYNSILSFNFFTQSTLLSPPPLIYYLTRVCFFFYFDMLQIYFL